MFYLLLSIASIMLVIIGLFQLIYFNPNRTDQNGKKITRKRLIFAVIFFTVSRSSQKTLEDGLGKIIEGVRYNDSKELENGQTVTTMALILFESYVQKQSDVKKMIDDKYIENFILDN